MADSDPSSSALAALRRQIDEVDDQIQDLVIRRAALIEQVSGTKQSAQVGAFRPGREAQILRRLVGRHRGRFPRPALVRIWREIIGGAVAMQTELSVAVAEGCWDMARDHFGSQAPLFGMESAEEVVLAIGEGRAYLGVVPLPEEDDPDPWWLALAETERQVKVIARIPFGTLGNAAGECQDAFVVAAMEPEQSGDDCTLLAIAAKGYLTPSALTDALLEARLDATPLAAIAHGDGPAFLVEVDAALAAGDPRIDKALAPLDASVTAHWLGLYARPLPDVSLGGVAPE